MLSGPGGVESGSGNIQRLPQGEQASDTKVNISSGKPGESLQTNRQMLFKGILPKGMQWVPGKTLWGQVIGRKGNFINLKFGKFIMNARSQFPFSTGQRIQVAFTNQRFGNQVQFQLLKSFIFSSCDSRDLSETLTKMNIPADEKNISLAKGMVEFKIPLTAKNFTEFSRALSSLKRPVTSTDIMATSFLKMSDIPLTTNNIIVLSNFISRHPLLGAQLFQLKSLPSSPGKGSKNKIDQRNLEVIEELKKSLNKYIIDPKKQDRQNIPKNLKNLAKEQGIEKIKYGFGGANLEEGWELMRLLKEVEDIPLKELILLKGEYAEKLKELSKGVEENLNAHQIINSGRPESDLAFYFLQIPLKLDDEDTTMELKLRYEEDETGKSVDPENTEIEFDVTTENLGDIHVGLKIEKGKIDMDIGLSKLGIEDFIKKYIPLLKINLENLGYETRGVETGILDNLGKSIIERENFEVMEKVDVNA